MRLQIKPGLRTVWRGDGTVQVGLDAGHGAVLDGLTPPDRALVELLVAGIDESDLPPASSPEAVRAHALVRLLAASGVLVDRRAGRDVLARVARDAPRLAPDAAVWSVVHDDAGDGWELLAARAHRVVEIRGAGRTGTALATALAAAGVGQVDLVDERPVTPADVGPAGAVRRDVGRAAHRAVLRTQAALRGPEPAIPAAVPVSGPDLVVLVHGSAADSTEAAALVRAGLPHLAVVVRERGVLVGPLVLPGRSPCLRCLDLQRTDRDPAWPRVLAQLTARGGRVPEETASALLAASLAALQVLGHLDGRRPPAALAATLEVELPDGLVSRRPWVAHRSCGCTSLVRAGDGPGHRERADPTEGTMEA
jgi:hypothetical protein